MLCKYLSATSRSVIFGQFCV